MYSDRDGEGEQKPKRGFGRGRFESDRNGGDDFSRPRGRGRGIMSKTSEGHHTAGNDTNSANEDMVTISVNSREVGRIIGKGGSKIRQLEEDSGARIKVSRDKNGPTVDVDISGGPEEVAEAQRLINDIINDSDFGNDRNYNDKRGGGFGSSNRGGFGRDGDQNDEETIIEVDGSKVGKIIGRGGSKIRELQDDSGAHIDVPRGSRGPTVAVSITGNESARQIAKELIEELMKEDDFGNDRNYNDRRGGGFGSSNRGGFGRDGDQNDEETIVEVDGSKVGKIIGRGGSRIRELQDDSGAHIDVPRGSRGATVPVSITGSDYARQKAKELIEEIMNEDDSNYNDQRGGRFGASNRGGFGGGDQNGEETTIDVEGDKVGLIIGKGGSKIRELQDDSGAYINVPRGSRGATVSVSITGSEHAREKARELIEELINEGY